MSGYFKFFFKISSTLLVFSWLILTTLGGVSLARENMPKLNVDISCNEIDAKSYYADGSVENVKLDGEGLQVEVRPDHLSTKFKTLSIKTKYKYVSGFLEEKGGKQYFNLSFTQEYGGTWGTKTVTLMFDGEMGRLWLIQSEPMIERGRPFIRTKFHWCE